MFLGEGCPSPLGGLTWQRAKVYRRPCLPRFTGGRQDSSRGLPFAAVSFYFRKVLAASPFFSFRSQEANPGQDLRRSSLGPGRGLPLSRAYRSSPSL